jgi:hypothetical protein
VLGVEPGVTQDVQGDLCGAQRRLVPVTAYLDSIGYDAAYGIPYGPFSDEAGTPVGTAIIHAALVAAHR